MKGWRVLVDKVKDDWVDIRTDKINAKRHDIESLDQKHLLGKQFIVLIPRV